MAVIKNFKATNVWKAFVLNSIATTLTIFVGITIKGYLDTYDAVDEKSTSENEKSPNNNKNSPIVILESKTNITSIISTLVFTFIASMVAYISMYFLFDFGGGMLVN